MKTPAAEITVNGKPVASIFNERIISVTVTDKEGVTSDTVSCELNDGSPFAKIPMKGDTIGVRLGYRETGLEDFGTYTADDPEVTCLPYGMTVNGKGANVRDQAKQHRSRHWDKMTVEGIVSEIAAENDLDPVIDGEIGSHVYEWFGQQDESDLHVVERLARRHGALFLIKAGRLIFAAKGTGRSVSGAALPHTIATPANIVAGTCKTTFSFRHQFKKVKARVQDREEAKIVEVEEDSHEDGTAEFTLPEPFADEAEAQRAAGAKATDLKRETIRTSVTLLGDPTIRAGALFFYDNVHPELDVIDFIIETATHVINKSGYTTRVDAKLYVPAKSAATSGSVGSGASQQPSKTSADDASGSPRPAQFRSPRSLGDKRRL